MKRVIVSVVMGLWAGLSSASEVSYQRDVQPILTHKCVACHACYDAPCQVNLTGSEGVLRGMNPVPVYDGARRQAEAPTRLYFDAQGEAEWRRKGFVSVLDNNDAQASLMMRMLSLGKQNPWEPNSKLPEDLDLTIVRNNVCAAHDAFDAYAAKTPHGGMPFAVAGLTDAEFQTLQQWLEQGAKVEPDSQAVSPAVQQQVDSWEAFFNQPGAHEALVNRWLFEHLFLAHLYFKGEKNPQFFQLLRSRTPPGEPIDPIATRRPNEDPGTSFYYRLALVQGVLVHKTHITYELSDKKRERIESLFYTGDWDAEAVPGYGIQRRANPFETFAAIPAQARYQFMLDNAEYFVRTFIRGPVCRGQIATDVIRDHFWALFQSPERDLYLTDDKYREEATPLLAMPGQMDNISDLPSLWRNYRNKRNEYADLRRDAYAEAPAPSWSSLWAGNDNALLSIFRQHDSASVRKGLVGAIPQTIWLFDYPLFERTYYQLVVNFDVTGNLSHQAQTRLYFDLIRNGAELNFLRLMPAESREGYLDDWYQNTGKLKMWLDYAESDFDTPSGLKLPEADPKHAFATRLLERYGSLNARPDPINRCVGARCYRSGLAAPLADAEQALSRLSARPASGLKVIDALPEATMLRVEWAPGKREIYSLMRNRAHSNVAFLTGENLRYQPGLDTLTVYPGVFTSYPNFIFNVPALEVPEFVQAMEQARDDKPAFEEIVKRWGIRRTHPQFWTYFHDLTLYLQETDPVDAAVLDMNRYENL